MEVPLPWERVLWTSRAFLTRYVLTDFRLVAVNGDRSDEIAIEDFADIQRSQRWPQRLAGVSTIAIARRGRHQSAPFVLHNIRRGPQLAALLELLAGDPRAPLDAEAVRSALEWEPPTESRAVRRVIAGTAVATVAVFAVAIRLSGTSAGVTYRSDDEISPRGQKRPRDEIVRFMETDVMPWATVALRPVVGAKPVTCETCHGDAPEARDWQMPSVAVLPAPEFRRLAWEHSTVMIDAQLRNAIYGYFAESDNLSKAQYMREVVMPGMARLLHRPAYDFARSYEYNRSQSAFGCYHCHRVN